jgi:hypothetical protein
MNPLMPESVEASRLALDRAPPTIRRSSARERTVFRVLEKIHHGSLELRLPDGNWARFGSRSEGVPRASMRLANWNVFGAALKSGDIGFAESYIAGDWATGDLAALLELFIANRDAVESMIYGSWWGSLLHRLKHLGNRNSRRGSRKNIQAHYDLGNAFYRLWLDPTMNYSGAWFDGDRSGDLVAAQWAKTRRALTACGVQPGDRVLEIGCGWGALAESAAREFGATVHGVTLSAEQLAWGRRRLADANLPGRLEHRDYRDIDDGPYDAIASIEMFEAVGPGLLARLLRRRPAPAQARRPGLHPDHHDPRRPVRALRRLDRFHSAIHLSRRPAAECRSVSRRGDRSGPRDRRRTRVRRRLCRNAASLARLLPGR